MTKRHKVPEHQTKANTTLVDESFKQELRGLLEEYVADVMKSELSDASKSVYIGNAEYFVSWVHGDVRMGKFGVRGRDTKPFK